MNPTNEEKILLLRYLVKVISENGLNFDGWYYDQDADEPTFPYDLYGYIKSYLNYPPDYPERKIPAADRQFIHSAVLGAAGTTMPRHMLANDRAIIELNDHSLTSQVLMHLETRIRRLSS